MLLLREEFLDIIIVFHEILDYHFFTSGSISDWIADFAVILQSNFRLVLIVCLILVYH